MSKLPMSRMSADIYLNGQEETIYFGDTSLEVARKAVALYREQMDKDLKKADEATPRKEEVVGYYANAKKWGEAMDEDFIEVVAAWHEILESDLRGDYPDPNRSEALYEQFEEDMKRLGGKDGLNDFVHEAFYIAWRG